MTSRAKNGGFQTEPSLAKKRKDVLRALQDAERIVKARELRKRGANHSRIDPRNKDGVRQHWEH